ncbi:probable G-protein coupled receptor No18 isoform X2 [Onthophagus taurus]|uniref:probable G-protein coupled receptor No18 isoform X2 n=1 Tax=Onthophagus taurus TaxID=166361 RepID=UPI000C206106|nr:probable G-protein coupled receptor No18 isoform X2 [Onthophagus taurus]
MQEDNNFNVTGTEDASKHIEDIALAILLAVVIIITLIGNTLVIIAVLTTRRLRTVTNCFVMSVAIADWLVGITVMPPAIVYRIRRKWEMGWILCDIWISLDILLCTASILSLCAISIDRYLAVTQPLSYSRKRRSKRLAFSMILVVWVISALITCPPMFGWYEPGRHNDFKCTYNANAGYVVFSAMFSFFIPMTIMLYVYVRISCIVAQRHDQLSHINSRKGQKLVLNAKDESELDRMSSDCDEHNVNIKCTRYISQLSARITAGDPINQNNHNEVRKNGQQQSRSLRSTLNYTFTPEPATPQRAASFYTPTTPLPANRSRPESLQLDVSILNFEPATRVSSFRRETKTAQTLSIVVGGFIACWLPFFIYYVLMPILPKEAQNNVVMGYFTFLGWINSAINPFIYAFYSPDFRIAFWRLTCRHCSKSRRTNAFQHR